MHAKLLPLLIIISLLLAGCANASNPAQPATEASLPTPVISPIGVVAVPTADFSGVESKPRVPAEPIINSHTEPDLTSGISYPIVDTAQGKCYDASLEIPCSQVSFNGQDAQYSGNAPRYQDTGDGTISDLVTGLMWQKDPGEKMTYAEAVAGAEAFSLAGYDDWRLPSIKELYSLILFDGTDVSACIGDCSVTPFIDTRYFGFEYGDTDTGERVIDSQFASSTRYVSLTMGGETIFGVNFADGRIKGYGIGPMMGQSEDKKFFVLYVRGNPAYGQNSFVDNGDGTISDLTTGLTWMQFDNGSGITWEDALDYCEDLDYAEADDWRLPDVKELQSIVDYTRSPATTDSAAIDPLFSATAITDEAGKLDYPFYWSSTTHADSSGRGAFAAYVAFGEALGYMGNAWIDVHGAGAQRSDPKSGDPAEYASGHGPQGDAVRIYNYARCVRGGEAAYTSNGVSSPERPAMTIQSTSIQQGQPGGMPGQGGGPGAGGGPGLGGTPPQAAIEACSASPEGAACELNTPNGLISGTCQLIQEQLACTPAGGAPGRGIP